MKFKYIFSACLSCLFAYAEVGYAETFTIQEDNARLYYAEGVGIQPSYTVQEAIARAVDANPDLDAAFLQIETKALDAKSRIGAMFPAVTSSASYMKTQGSAWTTVPSISFAPPSFAYNTIEADVDKWNLEWQIAAVQPLFPFHSLIDYAKMASLEEDSARLQFENAKLQLSSAIQTTFIEYLRFDALINTTNSAISRAEEQLNTTRVSFELGLRPKLDVLQAEVDLATLENNLLQVENQKEIVRAALQSMMALPLTEQTEFVGSFSTLPKFELTFEECLERAMDNRLELQLGRITVSIAEKGHSASKSIFFPMINLTAAYSVTGTGKEESGDSEVLAFGAVAEWHIFTGLSRYNTVKKAGIGESQARYALMSSMDKIASEVKTQYLNVFETSERIDVTARAVEKATESYNAALASYELGIGTNLDVMLAQLGLANEESNHTSAQADYFLAISRLHTAMGEIYALEL